jgi:hypothetical protein
LFKLNDIEESDRVFLAPEIFTFDEQIKLILVDKLDIFALGVTLFISEFKQPPFRLASMRDPLYRYIASTNPQHNE